MRSDAPACQSLNLLIDSAGLNSPLLLRVQVTAILVLYGLPRLLTGSILAHEVMHAWLRMHGCTHLGPKEEEGLCQLVALLWLERQDPTALKVSPASLQLHPFIAEPPPPPPSRGAGTDWDYPCLSDTSLTQNHEESASFAPVPTPPPPLPLFPLPSLRPAQLRFRCASASAHARIHMHAHTHSGCKH